MDNQSNFGYWDKRFDDQGHTGYCNELLYKYDQPLRIRAICKALKSLNILPKSETSILDIGCGSGDLIDTFLELGCGSFNVYGCDISERVINHAKNRFSNSKNVKFIHSSAEHVILPSESIDLVTSVTVLQHITDNMTFIRAVENIINIVKPGGHILILESSPIKRRLGPTTGKTDSYFALRTRADWIDAFQQMGCVVISEVGMPHIGVRFLRALNKAIKLIPFIRSDAGATVATETPAKGISLSLYSSMQRIILCLSKPLDYLFIPFPKNYTDLRILVFKK